jgi:Spy/CpxP family protein refolding chaperone
MSDPTTPLTPDAPAAAPASRRGRKIGGLLLLTFLCGAICGSALTLILLGRAQRHTSPARIPHRITERLAAELDLTETQKERIEAIYEERHAALMALREAFRPRILEEMRKGEEKVAEVLTPEQRTRYTELIEKMKKAWLRRGGPRRHGRPHKSRRPADSPAARPEGPSEALPPR